MFRIRAAPQSYETTRRDKFLELRCTEIQLGGLRKSRVGLETSHGVGFADFKRRTDHDTVGNLFEVQSRLTTGSRYTPVFAMVQIFAAQGKN